MILTAQEEFGLRCSLSLARAQIAARLAGGRRDSEEPSLTLGQIAGAEGLTSPYAGKILRVLVQAGVVESTRGRSGGYRLARPSTEISVAEVLQALGSKFYDGEICQGTPATGSDLCVHNNDCSVRSLWSGLQGLIDGYLTRTSLADLICDESSMARLVSALREEIEPERVGERAK